MPSKQNNLQIQQRTEQLDKWFPRIARFFVLAIFIVHPLIIMPDTYYSIVDTKRIFFTIVLCVTCATLLFLGLAANSLAPGYLKWPGFKAFISKIRFYEWALLTYFLVMLISTFLSDYPKLAVFGSGVSICVQ